MKEIGGYLELEQLVSNEYYPNLIALNTARNALVYLLKARKIQKVYLPYFLCDSVSKICQREGYAYEYYAVKHDFTPDFEKTLAVGEYLYIVNYYGQITNETIVLFKEKYKNIIIDNVQAFFQPPVEGVDTLYSCRKFFGVPDGAYLSTDCMLCDTLKTDVSANRLKHLLGRLECGSASDYYSDFQENDESFSTVELKYMSKLTHNLLGAVDYEKVKRQRENNFQFLHQNLKEHNKLTLNIPIGAYAYPFYCENGADLRNKLVEKRIYVPTLWPNVLHSIDRLAAEYAKNILPLPVDQRYDEKDLERVIDCIKSEVNS